MEDRMNRILQNSEDDFLILIRFILLILSKDLGIEVAGGL